MEQIVSVKTIAHTKGTMGKEKCGESKSYSQDSSNIYLATLIEGNSTT